MQDILIFSTVLSPIILALVEVVKRSLEVPVKYIPVVAVIIGLVVGYTSYPFSTLTVELRLWAGVLSALSAVGLFELVKKAK